MVVPRVLRARGFWGRAIGLMGRRDLPPDEALWLSPCSAIHTFFMRFPIDALFHAADGTLLRVATDVRPGRWNIRARGAAGVIELRAGAPAAARLRVGDRLRWIPLNSADGAVRGREFRPPE